MHNGVAFLERLTHTAATGPILPNWNGQSREGNRSDDIGNQSEVNSGV